MIQEDSERPIRAIFAYSIDKSKFICGYDLDTRSGSSTLKPIEVIALGYQNTFVQGGKAATNNLSLTSKAVANFAISFKRVLTIVGTIDAKVGDVSQANIDDGISWTLTKVQFEHFTHYYVAIGL